MACIIARGATRRLSAILALSSALLVLFSLPAASQGSCPSSPAAQGTFPSILQSLISRVVGIGSTKPRSLTGALLSELDSDEQREVADDLIKELSGRRAEATESRQSEEAEERLAELRRKILARDTHERLAARRGLRGRDASGRLKPGLPLNKIIEEESESAEPSLGAKYGSKYVQAIYTAVESDPMRFLRAADAVAGGRFWDVKDDLTSWGASGFSTVVGDVLDEMGLESTKDVWDTAVENSEAATEIMKAVARGDHNAAWDKIKDEYKSKVVGAARSAASGIINWAASSTGEVPSIAGKSPGEIYLATLDAEIQLIDWSKRFIRERSAIGDGECIRRYKNTYASNGGDTNHAYEAFAQCLPTSRFSSFFEFESLARQIGLDYTTATKQFLEAHRLGQSEAWTPIEWISARVLEAKERMQSELGPELTKAERVMSDLGQIAIDLTNERLADLAASKLSDAQWKRIEKEVRELEQKINATMAEVQSTLNSLRNGSDAVEQACKTYDNQKTIAKGAFDEGIGLSAQANQLLSRLNGVDISACRGDGSAAPDRGARSGLSARVKSLADSLDTKLGSVCSAAAEIRGAKSKEAARKRLDDALAAAREVEGIARQVSAAADELANMSAALQSQSGRGPRVRAAQSAIASLRGEVNSIAGRFSALRDGRFTPAKNAMGQAVQRVDNLATGSKDLFARATDCLRPFEDAPMAVEPRNVLAELQRRATGVTGCQAIVKESWFERDRDPSPGGGPAVTGPWSQREMALATPIGQLQAKLAELEAACGSIKVEPDLPAADMAADKSLAASAKARADGAVARMQKCVADAITAYNDAWLNPKISASDISCEPAKNERMIAELRDAANAGSDKARATLATFESANARIQSALSSYQAGKAALDGGDVSGAEPKLLQAKSALDQLGGKPNCSALSQQIGAALDRVKRIKDALAKADEAAASCNVPRLNSLRGELAQMGPAAQPWIATIDQALQQIAPVRAAFEQARASFSRGEVSVARTQAMQARSAVAKLRSCSELSQSIDALINQIDQLADALAGAQSAIDRCDEPAIKDSIGTLSRIANPAAREMLPRLNTASSECAKQRREKETADARDRCTSSFGNFSEPIPATIGRNLQCQCRRGYSFTSDNKSCVSDQEMAAQRNADCRREHGNNYYAGPPLRDGSYYCLPTAEEARSVCREKYGALWYPGTISANGAFDCHRDEAAAQRVATQECINTYGQRFIRLVRRGDDYLCEYSTGQAQQPSQGHDPQVSAAIIGAIGAAAAAVSNSRQNPRSSSPPPPPASRCHHRPATSTQHCGSN